MSLFFLESERGKSFWQRWDFYPLVLLQRNLVVADFMCSMSPAVLLLKTCQIIQEI